MIKKFLKYTTCYLLIYLFVFSFPFIINPPKFGQAYAAIGRGSSKEECLAAASQGWRWHEGLRGCIKQEKFSRADEAARNCLVLGGNEKVTECLKNIMAELNSDVPGVQDKYLPDPERRKKMLAHTLAFAAPGILPIFWYLKQLNKKKSSFKSKWTSGTALSIHAMTGATLIAVLGEANQNKKYLEKVESRATTALTIGLKLKPDYDSGEDANGEVDLSRYEPIDSTNRDERLELQQQSNQYMIDTENDMQEFFEAKSKAHKNAALLYSAAALYAGFEAIQGGLTKPPVNSGCESEKLKAERADAKQQKRDDKLYKEIQKEWENEPIYDDINSGPHIRNGRLNREYKLVPGSGRLLNDSLEKQFLKILNNMFPVAYANESDPQNSGIGANKGVQYSLAGLSAIAILYSYSDHFQDGPGCLMEIPLTRIIIASAGATMSGIFADKYKREKENSEAREVTFQMFADSYSNSCSKEDRQRNKAGNENCFCLNEGGTWNVNRTNNDICQAYLGKKKALASTNYNNTPGNDRVGCIDSQSKWDPKCKCKKGNSCMKLKKMSGFPGLTNTAWYNQLGAGANAALSDSFGSGNTNFDAAGNNAIKAAKAIASKLVKEADAKGKADAKSWKKINDGFVARAHNNIRRAYGGKAPSSAVNNSIAASKAIKPSSDPKDILKSAREQLNITKHSFGGGAKSSPNSGGGDDWDFNSGGTTPGGLSQGKFNQSEVDAAMNEQYSLNEINENSHQNLFEVITHRYHQSGLKNLFKEEEDTN
ncbi:hypothetical protein N9N67_01755 [Bacteriovoracaceae bacterium]|nr:hypothetical protein [Bacteriovoracaceae bacterium]